jgi:hypothetical protein
VQQREQHYNDSDGERVTERRYDRGGQSQQQQQRQKNSAASEWMCADCGTENWARRLICFSCKGSDTADANVNRSKRRPPPPCDTLFVQNLPSHLCMGPSDVEKKRKQEEDQPGEKQKRI